MEVEGIEPTRAIRQQIYSLPRLLNGLYLPRGLNHIGSLPVYIGDITEPLPNNTGIVFSGALDLVCFVHDLICLPIFG